MYLKDELLNILNDQKRYTRWHYLRLFDVMFSCFCFLLIVRDC
jgi:uncharacterized membrane protein YjjP (DUF1212 family)